MRTRLGIAVIVVAIIWAAVILAVSMVIGDANDRAGKQGALKFNLGISDSPIKEASNVISRVRH